MGQEKYDKKMREKMLQLGMIDKFKFAFRNAVVAYVGFAVLAILNIVIYYYIFLSFSYSMPHSSGDMQTTWLLWLTNTTSFIASVCTFAAPSDEKMTPL